MWRPVKILQICPDFPPYVRGGGAETFRLLAGAWTSQGHKVTVITSVPGSIHGAVEEEAFPYDVEYIRLMPSPPMFREASYFFPVGLPQFLRLRRLLRAHAADADVIAIHGLAETVPLLSLLLLKRYSDKAVVTQHGISAAPHTRIMSAVSEVLYRSLGKIAISPYRRIIVYSSETRSRFLNYFGRSSGFAITEIPLGIDTEEFKKNFEAASTASKTLNRWARQYIGMNEPFIFAVGRNVRIKGFDTLIRAFSLISASNSTLRLVIGGDETEYTKELRALDSDLDLADKTVFTGRLTEQQKIFLMLNSSCFVIPSRSEGYGLNAVEAAILQVRTVATMTGAHAEILGKTQYSRIVPPEDVEALSSAIKEAIESGSGKYCFSDEAAGALDIRSLSEIYTQGPENREQLH